MKPYILPNYNPDILIQNKKYVAELYNEYGVVIFPNFFKNNDIFQSYIDDLNWVFKEIISRHSNDIIPDDTGDKLVMLNQLKSIDGKIITNLGTQHNKFNSFNRIKYSNYISSILKEIYNNESILVTPQSGDTLHFFPPGNEFYKYNLPPHQDYQYLMQSPSQITFYMGLSNYKDNVGGLRIWEKSHKLGILPSTTNEFGAFEVADYKNILKDFETLDYGWNIGDFGFFDSLISHSSIPNISQNNGRIVQIFRFSDINNCEAKKYNFKSTVYKREGIEFADHHSSLLKK
jgi:hypothetical protein